MGAKLLTDIAIVKASKIPPLDDVTTGNEWIIPVGRDIAKAQDKISFRAGKEAERKAWKEQCKKSGIPLSLIW